MAQSLFDPPRGLIEAATIAGDVSEEARGRAEDFLLSFAIVSALAGEFGALDAAIEACLAAPEIDALRPLLERMKGNTREYTEEREIIAIVVNALRNDNRGTPEELVWAGVWLLLHARATKWKDLVVPPITSWLFEQWEYVLRHGRFALVMPALNAPAIEAAIADSDRSLSAAARLTLAAVPAAGTVLTQQVLGILAEMAVQRPAAAEP